ncbi:hypothetical protein AVEN_234006-1, partial [Araneus ventricosus]
MWAPLSVDELLRFVYEGTCPPRVTEMGGAVPPPVIVRAFYGRGRAVRLCWPLGPNLSTRFYRNDCHSDFPCVLAGRGDVIYGYPTVCPFKTDE